MERVSYLSALGGKADIRQPSEFFDAKLDAAAMA
jgi:hypothetical protein